MRKIYIDNIEISEHLKTGTYYTLFKMKNGEQKAVYTYEYEQTYNKNEPCFLLGR